MESPVEALQTRGALTPKPALAPKPRLTPKPFSLQKNTTIRSIHAPRTSIAPSQPTTHQARKSVPQAVLKAPLTTPTLKPPQQTTTSAPAPAKDETKSTGDSGTSPQGEDTTDLSAAPGESEPASQSAPPKQTSTSEPIQKEDDIQTNHKTATEIESVSEDKDLSKKDDESLPAVVQKPEESGSNDSSADIPTFQWGGNRKRLSMKLTSKFESGGVSLPPQPAKTTSRTNSKPEVKQPSPLESETSLTASEPSAGEQVEVGLTEENGGGGSIKRRISLLFDSSSRPEVPAKREETEIINGTGGVKERIKTWTAEVSPRTEKKPQVVTRVRAKSFEPTTVPTIEETPKSPPVEHPVTAASSTEDLDPSSPAESPLDTSEAPPKVDLLERSTETPKEPERNQSTEADVPQPVGSPAATVPDVPPSAVSGSAPRRGDAKRRSVRFGVVERDDGGPPIVLGSESESSADEDEAPKGAPEEDVPVSLPAYRKVGILRKKDEETQREEEERLKHLEFDKRRKAEENEKERLKLEEEKKQKEEEEKEREEARRLREEERRCEEEKERVRLKEEEEARRLREEEKRCEEEKERVRLKEEEEARRMREEERRCEEEKERVRLKEEEEARRMREEERRCEEEKERVRLKEEEKLKEEARRMREEEKRCEEEKERVRLKEEEKEKQRMEEWERERLREEEKKRERLREEEMERERQMELILQREEDRERVKQKEERPEEDQEEREEGRLKEEEKKEETVDEESESKSPRQEVEERLIEDREKTRQTEERLRQEDSEREKLREEAEDRARKEEERQKEEERMREIQREEEEERKRRELERKLQQEKEEEMERLRQIEMERQMEEERKEEERKREAERELERKRQEEEEQGRMEAEREKEEFRLTNLQKEVTTDEAETNLISFDSEDLPQIEVLYDDFSVKPSSLKVDYDDFSVKPKRWGSQERAESSPAQRTPLRSWEEEVEMLVDVSPLEKEVPQQEEKTDSLKPTAALEEEEEEEEEKPDEEQLISIEVEEEEEEEETHEDKGDEEHEAEIKSYCTDGEDKDTDALIPSEPEQQDGPCEETPDTDSPKPVTEQFPEISNEVVDTTDFQREPELVPFPESSTPLLDTSAQRSKADLSKRRIRSRPSRSVRAGRAQTDDQEGTSYDSTDAKEMSSRQKESDTRENPSKPKIVGSPSPTSQRVPMFPGLNPAALIAQMKKRTGGGGTDRGDETEEDKGREEKQNHNNLMAPSPSQLPRSPRSAAHLAGAARVLPPLGGPDGGVISSPSWLKELKSKKRLSQHEGE